MPQQSIPTRATKGTKVIYKELDLYHIPSSLIVFTVTYLSSLFSTPNSYHKRQLNTAHANTNASVQDHHKQPQTNRTPDNRQYPEFRYFIETLLYNGRISADTLVHALIYLSRLHRRMPKRSFFDEGAKHKIFLSALLVASKFCDDCYPLSTEFVCGLLPEGLFSLAEVNRMERAFLSLVHYKLIVDLAELKMLLLTYGASPFQKGHEAAKNQEDRKSDIWLSSII